MSDAPLPVFVYGALRSGTTMFRLMLETHPETSNPGETDFLFDHLHADASHATGWRYDLEALAADRIFQDSGLIPVAGQDGLDLMSSFFGQYADRAPGKLTTLNLHRGLEKLARIFPGAQILHLVRDPRDVARSSIGMGWAGTLYHGANHWIGTEMAWESVSGKLDPSRIMTLRYEDLFADVEGSLRAVCGFLGLEYDPVMLTYHETSTYGPPDASLVEQWRRRSSPREIAELESRCSELMERRGYVLTGTGQPPTGARTLELGIRNRLAVWAFRRRRYGLPLMLGEKFFRDLGFKPGQTRLRARMNVIERRHLK